MAEVIEQGRRAAHQDCRIYPPNHIYIAQKIKPIDQKILGYIYEYILAERADLFASQIKLNEEAKITWA